ncbi:hypothetical protein ACUN3E_37385 [Streptomyces sp. Ju416(a)]|uniref:hypothetical protein n=1 Tax=Streptomyces sp. Ju416(a) TaxID=3446591 RepID=UPI00403DB941
MTDTDPTITVPAPSDDDRFWDSPLHDQVKDWLRTNGIPLRIPRRDITVTGPPGNRTIHYTAFVLGTDGQVQIDPDSEGEPLTKERTTPCLVEPPTAVTEEAK